ATRRTCTAPSENRCNAGGDTMSGPNPIEGVQTLNPVFPWREEAPAQAVTPIGGVPPGEIELRSGTKGPVTAARHVRNALVYAGPCWLRGAARIARMWAGWQAFGLGLFMPGAGFLAAGGATILLFPLTVGLFWLSVVAWF